METWSANFIHVYYVTVQYTLLSEFIVTLCPQPHKVMAAAIENMPNPSKIMSKYTIRYNMAPECNKYLSNGIKNR